MFLFNCNGLADGRLVTTCNLKSKVSERKENSNKSVLSLQYDYEYDEHGERVILGKGTFGVVYAGRDLSNQVRLAIKEIPERDSRSEKKMLIIYFFVNLCHKWLI